VSQRRSDLDCRYTDATRAALNQQRLARRQATPIKDVAPDGEVRLRKRGRFGEGHPAGTGSICPIGAAQYSA